MFAFIRRGQIYLRSFRFRNLSTSSHWTDKPLPKTISFLATITGMTFLSIKIPKDLSNDFRTWYLQRNYGETLDPFLFFFKSKKSVSNAIKLAASAIKEDTELNDEKRNEFKKSLDKVDEELGLVGIFDFSTLYRELVDQDTFLPSAYATLLYQSGRAIALPCYKKLYGKKLSELSAKDQSEIKAALELASEYYFKAIALRELIDRYGNKIESPISLYCNDNINFGLPGPGQTVIFKRSGDIFNKLVMATEVDRNGLGECLDLIEKLEQLKRNGDMRNLRVCTEYQKKLALYSLKLDEKPSDDTCSKISKVFYGVDDMKIAQRNYSKLRKSSGETLSEKDRYQDVLYDIGQEEAFKRCIK